MLPLTFQGKGKHTHIKIILKGVSRLSMATLEDLLQSS